MHYKDYLSEEPKSRQEIGLAVLLHTSVRALSVQSVLRCGTKNAQSAAVARDYFEKRYPSGTPRQVAEGILKGLSVCTGCAAAPQWPLDLSPPSEGISLPKLKMEGLFTDVAQIKKVRGRLRNQPDCTSCVAAFNAWFVRSRKSHVCGPPV